MKKITKTILLLFVLTFAFFSSFNSTLAVNTTEEDISTSQSADSQITTTVSSASSANEELLSVTNIINILLIAVGVVIILLAFAILNKLRHNLS